MATTTIKSSIPISPSTSLNNEKSLELNTTLDSSHKTLNNKEQIYGIPVKFADNLFSTLVKDQINQLINLPHIKQLQQTDENEIRSLTYQITEILKRIVFQHIKDNYKVIIQVITYPKQAEENILILSRCLWNYKTDDVLSLEIENDILKFLIVIHGIMA